MDSDERFKHLVNDPKFKKSRKQRVEIDERFQAIFTDEKFIGEAKDKRGWYSSDASSSSDESESEDEVDINEIKYDWEPLDHDAEKTDESSRRLAIQNLDWDQLDAKDIYTLVNSIRPPLSVKIYVSEFGKKRLEREEKEGPEELADMAKVDEEEEELNKLESRMKQLEDQQKPNTNKRRNNEYEDADEIVGAKDEKIRERIRKYQLARMKYFYAIVEFDSVESAEAVYKEIDGMEYEGSSLELDLRFVPDEMEFSAEDLKSECNEAPDLATYKAPQFIHSALQQTTVKFSWDETDVKRQEKLRKAYTKQEIEKDDLSAYLASDTESEDEEEEEDADSDHDGASTVKTSNRMNKYKMLLQELEEEEARKKKADFDVVWDDFEKDETAVAEVNAEEEADSDDGYDDADDEEEEDDEEIDEETAQMYGEQDDEEEQEDEVESVNRGKRRKKKDKTKKRARVQHHEEDKDLDLLMLDVDARSTSDFKFNPDDHRFAAIYKSGLYNIDPSHPNFKRTEAFNQMAEKKRSLRQRKRN